MTVLYIDTSSSYLYTGIVKDSKLISFVKKEFGHQLSSEALPNIASMFTTSGILPKDIDKIIVVNGPGSFTGIRVGLTIAKVYAWSFKIPITCITSLEVMALSFANKNNTLVPIIDARRGFVYAAIFDSSLKILMEPKHILLKDLYQKLPKNYIFITNDSIDLTGKKCSYNPDILKIVNQYVEKNNIDPHFVNPNYLKLTEAEERNYSD